MAASATKLLPAEALDVRRKLLRAESHSSRRNCERADRRKRVTSTVLNLLLRSPRSREPMVRDEAYGPMRLLIRLATLGTACYTT